MASIDSGVETGNESNDSPVTVDCTKDSNNFSLLPPLPDESSLICPIFSPKPVSFSLSECDRKYFSNIPVSSDAICKDNYSFASSSRITEYPRYVALPPAKLNPVPLLPMIEDGSSCSSSSSASTASTLSQLKLISEEYAREPLSGAPIKQRIHDGSLVQACSNREGVRQCEDENSESRFCRRNPNTIWLSRCRLKELRYTAYQNPRGFQGLRKQLISKERKSSMRSLFLAAQVNDVDRVRNLLLSGVSPNCYDRQERTPLHLAACKGYAEVVKLLLLFGANPDLRDGVGNTALHLAVCTNHLEVVSLLLKAGIDVCSSDFKGRSPLQLAQSKLKILQRSQDIDNIKSQVTQVIEMLKSFINKNRNSAAEDLDFLTTFQNKFKISDSAEQVGTDIKDLLAKLDNLSVSTAGANNNS